MRAVSEATSDTRIHSPNLANSPTPIDEQDPVKRFILDPTGEQALVQRERIARPKTIAGLTLGLLDISKARGDIFLDRLESELSKRGAIIRRYRKPTFTKPAPFDLRQQIAKECAAVVEALAD